MLVLVLFTISTSVMGQRPDREKIKAMKVGFLTEELSLTSSEAAKFFPVYNKYQDEKENLLRTTGRSMGAIELEEAKLNLKKKYDGEFKKVLPASKVEKLYDAEKKFKKELLQEARKRKERAPGR